MEKRYDVWVEITANKEWILDAVKFEETMKKCRAVGMTGIILSVKDTTGFLCIQARLHRTIQNTIRHFCLRMIMSSNVFPS